ncbi:MAG: Tat pathway signal protein [Halodesulfurarchaeum sp.]
MPPDGGIGRRAFLRSAVAVGGAAAFSACLSREPVDVPTGPSDPATLPRRQHAWNAVLPTDSHGNTVPPRHRILLYFQYGRTGRPTEADRRIVESALGGIERAYERSGRGLLVTISYSPAYFDRFEADLPEAVDLPSPTALAPFEDPEFDTPDAVVHLASNHASVVLGAEEALRGEVSSLNGVDQPDASLTDAFDVVDRRTGFVGAGLPKEHASETDVSTEAISESAPMLMGFKSGFEKNQASEDRVTIESGPFAGGTTQHISKLSLDLEQWYTQDSRSQREAKMFCPYHAQNDVVEDAGDNLGTESEVDKCRSPETAARELGVVGHTQKSAAAREGDSPRILRRDFNTTDEDGAGLHFLALQRTIEDFAVTREAMNGTALAERSAVGQRNNNGILQYIRTERRGNYLLPPRPLRALPPAAPAAAAEAATAVADGGGS